ncbi:hypothetical protein V6N13_021314 [Hibiscus sabdariffa]
MALLTSSIEALSTTTRNAPIVELLGTNPEAVSACTDNYSNAVLIYSSTTKDSYVVRSRQRGRQSGAGSMQQPLPFMKPQMLPKAEGPYVIYTSCI